MTIKKVVTSSKSNKITILEKLKQIKKILCDIENNNELSKKIIGSKKPMIILGESFLNIKSASYLFHSLKKFLFKNNKFTNEWNPLNILSTDAATVGNFDLDVINEKENLISDLK